MTKMNETISISKSELLKKFVSSDVDYPLTDLKIVKVVSNSIVEVPSLETTEVAKVIVLND